MTITIAPLRPARSPAPLPLHAALLVTALTAVHAFLWVAGNRAEGVWTQAPATDQSLDLTTALILFRSLSTFDLPGFIDGWMNASPVHTPFVPFTSALLMLLFGASRPIAEAVLPLFTGVWLLATYQVIRRLYTERTALWTTALVSTFPVFLIYSRTYLFEHPLAALFACACWALVASDGFSRVGPSIAFGVLAGVTCLTRGGAPAFLVGPLLVTLWSVRQTTDLWRRLGRAGLALAIGAVVAASWYATNAPTLLAYTHRSLRAGSLVSFGGAWSYARWIVAEGPGTLLVALLGAGVVGGSAAGWMTPLPSGTSLALAAVFAIDFLLLLPASGQGEQARYFQPLMPLVALVVVRSIETISRRWVRAATAAAVSVLAIANVVAVTGVMPVLRNTDAIAVAGIPLSYHQPYFSALADYYHVAPVSLDFRIGDVLDLLERQHCAPDALIATVETPHAFFQPNGLAFEAVRRRFACGRFVWLPFLTGVDYEDAARALAAMPVTIVLLRTGGPDPPDMAAVTRAFPGLFDVANPRFQHSESSLVLGDGSRVTVYTAVPSP